MPVRKSLDALHQIRGSHWQRDQAYEASRDLALAEETSYSLLFFSCDFCVRFAR